MVSLSVFLYDPLLSMLEIIPPDSRCFIKGATHSIYLLVIQENVFVVLKKKEERKKKEKEKEKED